MESYPTLDELIWLFESDPQLEYPDLGWPVSCAMFVTVRGQWTVSVDIEPYVRSIEIRLQHEGTPVVRQSMREVVTTIAVDRTHGVEALVVRFDRGSRLDAVRLTLKPAISLTFDSTRPWDT